MATESPLKLSAPSLARAARNIVMLFGMAGLISARIALAEAGSALTADPVDGPAADAPAEVCLSRACFPVVSEVDGLPLSLRGSAEYRYWGFKLYAAALYAPVGASIEEIRIASVPKQLRLTYYRDFSKKDFVDSGEAFIRDNPAVEFSGIVEPLAKMNALYRDIKPGDTYMLSYTPARGTALSLNAAPIGTVEGQDFAKAYFGIWLSEYSLSNSFTDQLFGDS